MPRQMRRESAGAIYRVMNRGDRREEVFRDVRNRRACAGPLTEPQMDRRTFGDGWLDQRFKPARERMSLESES